jgi:chemotaxis protein methyltransferase CheR
MNDLIREIANLIERQSGFVIREESFQALESFARQRVERGGFSGMDRFVDYLRRHPDSEEWRPILSRITIKESYLFRAKAQFDALATEILNEMAGRGKRQKLRVWCAGCARGEEAATLAIVLADHPVVGGWDWRVLATDVDDSALADARRGVYRDRALASVARATLARHFSRRGDGFELDSELRKRIEYRRLNLIDQPLDLAGEVFDVIFLRNVLIYFRPELQRRVIDSVEVVLAKGGTLFLGPSESLIHLGTNLQARDLGDCFCYRAPVDPPIHPAPASREDPESVKTSKERPGPSPMTAGEGGGGFAAAEFGTRLESAVDALETGEIKKAVAGLASLRHEYPESAVVHALEGVALERSGAVDTSVLSYRATLYLAPEMDEVRFLLARALDGLGRSKAAAREYRTALSGLGPSSALSTEFRRLGLPDHEQMSEICRDKLSII